MEDNYQNAPNSFFVEECDGVIDYGSQIERVEENDEDVHAEEKRCLVLCQLHKYVT